MQNLNISSATSYRRGGGGNFSVDVPLISFFEFRRLTDAGELDGLIIAEDGRTAFAKEVIHLCKLYGVPVVGAMDLFYLNPSKAVCMLDRDKSFVTYLEANIVDGCNLNCKGCTHYAGLFTREDIYPLENFRRDIRRISQICDMVTFRLIGGEPLLLKNLDEYVKISRQYLPKTDLRVATNGLLIPTLPQKILDAIRENNFIVDISAYRPTMKILDEIHRKLNDNGIIFTTSRSDEKETFSVFLTLHAGSVPEKSRAVCFNEGCRFLRNGKIYKCPLDALSYKYAESFGIAGFPKSTGVDIYAENFSSMLDMLDGSVEMCTWCGEKIRRIPWEPTNNPQITDWLVDPDEFKNFQ